MHEDQSSHFCDCFLVSKWIFQHHERCLTKFHAGSEQLLVCVVINNSSLPTVKNNNIAYHVFGEYWMQARAFLDNRSKYCWPEVICRVCQPNELKWDIKKKLGRQRWSQPKNLEVAHPGLTLESPLSSSDEQLKRPIFHTYVGWLRMCGSKYAVIGVQ